MDKRDFETLRSRCQARRAETERVGELIYDAIVLTDDEAVIDAMVSLAYKVLEPRS